MSTALAQRQDLLPDVSTWKTMLEMAGQLVESGMLPQAIKTPAAALAIIQKGRELGIPPMYALSNIGIINGRPVVGAEVLLAMVYRDHGDNAIQIEETSADRCALTYRRRGWAQARRFEWTAEDAKKAGLLGKSGPWSQYPAAMLRARCISAVARLAFADSIGGMYTAEEMGAEVDVTEDGEVVVVNQAPPVLRTVKPADVIQPEPDAKENERARAMVGDTAEEGRTPEQDRQRLADEQEYTRLAALAVAKGHKNADRIKGKQAKDLTDEVLAASVATLKNWEAKLPPVEHDDQEAF